MKNLYTKMWASLVALTVVMGILLFVPAGTIRYWQACVYLAIFTAASVLTSLYLIKKDPALLTRRMPRDEPKVQNGAGNQFQQRPPPNGMH